MLKDLAKSLLFLWPYGTNTFKYDAKNFHLTLVSILSTSHKKKKKPDTNSRWINTTRDNSKSLDWG